MAVTLLTIRTQVRSNLDEIAADAADWSDVELNRLINQWYHRVITAVMGVFEDYYITKDLFNITANQQEYGIADGLPSDVFKIRRVEVNYNPNVSTQAPTRCLPIDLDQVRRDLALTNAGVGIRVQQLANYYTFGFGSNLKIGFAPIPTVTGTSAGALWYLPIQTDLSADGDTINIPYPERYYPIVASGATSGALLFGQQDTGESNRLEAKTIADIGIMQEELEDKVSEESKFVLDVSGESLDFTGGY